MLVTFFFLYIYFNQENANISVTNRVPIISHNYQPIPNHYPKFRKLSSSSSTEVNITNLNFYKNLGENLTKLIFDKQNTNIPDKIQLRQNFHFFQAKDEFLFYLSEKNLVVANYNGNQKFIQIPYCNDQDSVVAIGPHCFNENNQIKSVCLPESVICILNQAFYNCINMTSLILPKKLQFLGRQFLYGCKNIKNISIYSNVESLDNQNSPFESSFVENAKFEDGVSYISSFLFFRCESIKSIILSSTVLKINQRSFSQCKSLSTVTIPENVVSIASDAFLDSPNVIFQIIPYSYAESYAIANHIPYRFLNNLAYFDMNITSTSDLRDMLIILKNHKTAAVLSIQLSNNRNIYSFGGVELNGLYSISIYNQYDILLFRNDTYRMTSSRTEMSVFFGLYQIYVTIVDNNKQDCTDMVKINWFLATDSHFITQNFYLNQIRDGACVFCRFYLNDELSRQFYNLTTYSVCAFNTHWQVNTTIQLTPIKTVHVSGEVYDGNNYKLLCGVAIFLHQVINNKYYINRCVTTSRSGYFTIQINNASTLHTFEKRGYKTYTVTISSFSSDYGGSVYLYPLKYQYFVLDINYKKSGCEYQKFPLLNLKFDIEYKSQKITDYFYEYPLLLINSTINPSKYVLIKIFDYSESFDSVTVISNFNEKLIHASIIEHGRILIRYLNSENVHNRAMIFNQKGFLVTTLNIKMENGLTKPLQKDQYQVVLIGENDLLRNVFEIKDLTEFSLRENADYAKKTVEVDDGIISNLTFLNIPKLDESKFYINSTATLFSVNTMNTVLNSIITLRSKIAFKDDFSNHIQVIGLFIEYSQGIFDLVGDSVYVNNEVINPLLATNALFVNLTNCNDLVHLCLICKQKGNFTITASIKFRMNGKTYLCSIGSVDISVVDFDFSVPAYSSIRTVMGSGLCEPLTNVEIYDNGVIVGKTKSNRNGKFLVQFELTGFAAYHNIFAQAVYTDGHIIRSKTLDLLYNGNSFDICNVTIFIGNQQQILIDYQNDTQFDINYFLNDRVTPFLFLAKFSSNDPGIITDVRFEIDLSTNEQIQIPAVYDVIHKGWIASKSFSIHSYPISVNVQYFTNTSFLIAPQVIDEEQINVDKLVLTSYYQLLSDFGFSFKTISNNLSTTTKFGSFITNITYLHNQQPKVVVVNVSLYIIDPSDLTKILNDMHAELFIVDGVPYFIRSFIEPNLIRFEIINTYDRVSTSFVCNFDQNINFDNIQTSLFNNLLPLISNPNLYNDAYEDNFLFLDLIDFVKSFTSKYSKGIDKNKINDCYALNIAYIFMNSIFVHVNELPSDFKRIFFVIIRKITKTYIIASSYRIQSHERKFYRSIDCLFDSSLIIYEASKSNRIDFDNLVIFEDSQYLDYNPNSYKKLNYLNLPKSNYQIQISKQGYQPYSLNLNQYVQSKVSINIPMISYAQPVVNSIICFRDSIDIEFSKYINIRTLNFPNLQILQNGVIIDGEFHFLDQDQNLASKIRFIPKNEFNPNIQIEATFRKEVESYANVQLPEAFTYICPLRNHVEMILDEEIANITYNKDFSIYTRLEIKPVDQLSGSWLIVDSDSEDIVKPEIGKYMIDSSGFILIQLLIGYPGTSHITFRIDGTSFVAKKTVNVLLPKIKLNPPIPSHINQSIFVYNSSIEFYTDLPDSDIYYSIQQNSFMKYHGSIHILDNCTITLIAKNDDYLDSDPIEYKYFVEPYFLVFFNSDGGNITIKYKHVLPNQAYGPLPTPIKTHFVFDGWYTSDSILIHETTIVDITENIVLKAHYNAIFYTITFEANGGTEILPIFQQYGSDLTEPETPQKSGFVFKGWFTDELFENDFNFNNATMPGRNMTLYAKWTPNNNKKNNKKKIAIILSVVFGILFLIGISIFIYCFITNRKKWFKDKKTNSEPSMFASFIERNLI